MKLRSREDIELQLLTELEAAKRQLQEATPDQLPVARANHGDALHRFTRLVLYGKVPGELWSA